MRIQLEHDGVAHPTPMQRHAAMALSVLKQFDKSFLEALNHVQTKATIKADLKTYRYFDNVRPCSNVSYLS